jgi:hypothetical protein
VTLCISSLNVKFHVLCILFYKTKEARARLNKLYSVQTDFQPLPFGAIIGRHKTGQREAPQPGRQDGFCKEEEKLLACADSNEPDTDAYDAHTSFMRELYGHK